MPILPRDGVPGYPTAPSIACGSLNCENFGGDPTASAPSSPPIAVGTNAGFPHSAAIHFLVDPETPELVRSSGQFFRFMGDCYEAVTDETVKNMVTTFLSRRVNVHTRPSRWNEVAVTRAYVEDAMLHVRAECEVGSPVQHGDWLRSVPEDFVGPGLAVKSGLVDIGRIDDPAGYMFDATPNFFSLAALPVKPDPRVECPRWNQFLADASGGDTEFTEVLQEYSGYCLLPNCKFEKFLAACGPGDTGKSTYWETMTAVLGHHNVANVPLERFGERFSLVAMHGKLANIVFDQSELTTVGAGQFKSIVSGEYVTLEEKFKPAFSGRITAKQIFVCNTLPVFSDSSSGLWRRLIVLPFTRIVPDSDRDPDLKHNLRAELPGIAHWALKGLARLLRQGGFSVYRQGEEILSQHRLHCNPVALFLDERCTADSMAMADRRSTYDQFLNWCAANRFKSIPITEFILKIDQIHRQPRTPPRTRRGGPRLFVGFALRDASTLADDIRNID